MGTRTVPVRGRSLLISWGGGRGWAILGGGGSWKTFYPKWGGGGGSQNFIDESMGGGGHKYDLHFLFWHQNALASGGLYTQTPSPIINFIIFHAPLFTNNNRKMKRYAYAEMPSVRFFYGNAHRHLIIRKYRQMHIDMHMGSILTSYWYFVEQNEMPEWNQLWDWAFQQAYVTRYQWTYTLTRIMFAEKHHKFQSMYVSESS